MEINKNKFTRRFFIKNGIRFLVLVVTGFGYAGRNNLKTEHLNLQFPNLPASFDGFRIVQISDLHASFGVGRNYLMQVVKEINELKKNLIVITGDFITGPVNEFWKRWMPGIKGDYIEMIIDVLSNLKEGKKIAVLGNHDQWDGKESELRLVNEL